MIYNQKGFFSWQGNNLEAHKWVNYLVFVVTILIALSFFIFKKQLRKIGSDTGRRWIFKNQEVMWRTFGAIGISFIIGRLVIMWVFGYSLWWEGLGLHLCRGLIFTIFLFLLFNKPQYMKYLMYLAIVGFIFGILFNYEQSDKVTNAFNAKGIYQYYDVNGKSGNSAMPTLTDLNKKVYLTNPTTATTNIQAMKLSHFERLMFADGITFYHAGYDNYFIYDTYLAHIALLLVPLWYFISRKQRVSVIEFHRLQLAFFTIVIVMWVLNIILAASPDQHWRSNFWFIGKNEYNDMHSALGPLSAWPQNIITYILLGVVFTITFHYMFMIGDKYEFFKDGKFVTKSKSKNYALTKQEYKDMGFKTLMKRVFLFKKA